MGILRAAGGRIAVSAVQSVLFSGTIGTESIDYDRLTSDRTSTGGNLGAASSDATVEMWIKPTSANSNTGTAWVEGHILLDNDMVEGDGSPVGGQYGLSVCNDTIRLGVATELDTTYTEFIGSTTVNDGNWHWIVFCWDASTGDVQLYIDGTRDVDSTRASGNLGWVSGGNTKAQLNEFAGEKNDFEGGSSLSLFGQMSEIRFSNNIRYDASTITVPTTALAVDGNTIAYWGFTEGSGTTIADGSSNGDEITIVTGGSPTVPTWSTDGPY